MTNLDAIREIAAALQNEGYWALDDQAAALGIPRSTAYTIMKCTHKIGRLNPKTLRRMLNNRRLPSEVRRIIERYTRHEALAQE